MAEPPADRRSADARRDDDSLRDASRTTRFVDDNGDRWVLRLATPDDRDALVEMYDDFAPASRTMGLPPRTRGRVEKWVRELLEDGINVVAAGDEHVVGHAFYTPSDDPEPEFGVFVHGDHRNRGIGTAVSKHVIGTAVAADRDALTLEVAQDNWAARDLYDALGFAVVDQFSVDHHGRSSGSLGMRLPLANDVAPDTQQPPTSEAD